jgi:HPt (histidine-containing phosphotransfer) domain-containing protein
MSVEPEITPEMRARYISRRRDDVAKLLGAHEAGDFAAISAIAHQIKGNAATFAFSDLEAYAIALETYADAKHPENCALEIAHIQKWVESQTTSV